MKLTALVRLVSGLAIVFAATITPALAGQDRGSPEEAQALVSRAVAMYDQAGAAATFAAIEDPKGEFRDRDLYIFVFGPARTIVAHGVNHDLDGTVADTLKDVDGAAFGTRLVDDATSVGAWVDYKWNDPVSGEVLQKSSWVVRHDGHVFGAGVYKTD